MVEIKRVQCHLGKPVKCLFVGYPESEFYQPTRFRFKWFRRIHALCCVQSLQSRPLQNQPFQSKICIGWYGRPISDRFTRFESGDVRDGMYQKKPNAASYLYPVRSSVSIVSEAGWMKGTIGPRRSGD